MARLNKGEEHKGSAASGRKEGRVNITGDSQDMVPVLAYPLLGGLEPLPWVQSYPEACFNQRDKFLLSRAIGGYFFIFYLQFYPSTRITKEY